MSITQEYTKKSITISKEDYFLFGSNITSLATFALNHLGYHAPLLKTISNVTLLASTLGESLLTTPSCSHLYAALPALTFFGARLFIDHQSQSNPSLKLISLAINGYGTCALAKKAITEAVKCHQGKISNLETAKVYLIHGTNVIASFVKTYMTHTDYKTSVNREKIAMIATKAKNGCLNNKTPKTCQDNVDTIVKKAQEGESYFYSSYSNSLVALGQLRDIMYSNINYTPGLRRPTLDELADNQVTSDMGQFTAEFLKKLDPKKRF